MEKGEVFMKRFVKCTGTSSILVVVALLASLALAGQAAAAAGATLQAAKTIDICVQSDGQWRYSGEVSVWNDGATATQGLQIYDCIQNKVSGPTFASPYCGYLTQGGAVTIPGFTAETAATVFPYSFANAPLAGTPRNDALVQITNHSGRPPGTLFGPEPKATYSGTNPPPACSVESQCTYSQGYWANKPGVVWPSPYDRGALFYISGQTWNTVANSPGGTGYYILAVQYIGAVLNAANGANVPSGVQDILNLANAWFTSNAPSACSTGPSCGTQKAWAAILEDYNLGDYPGSPGHCSDE
jgi:hypothetical protein